MKLKLVIIVFGIFLTACKKDKIEEVSDIDVECEETISFSSEIISVMLESCATAGCHNATSASSGYILETHGQISEHAAIVLKAIRHETGVSNMPKGAAKLSDDYIDSFYCWMEQGKQDN